MARPRASLGRASKAIGGIVPAGTEHKILLALRAAPMLQSQLTARFGSGAKTALGRAGKLGYITRPGIGVKGETVSITPAGRELLETQPTLSRRASEIVYCQL